MSNQLILQNHSLPPITSFEAYKNYVYSLPQLEEKDERELFIKFKTEGCLECAQKLVLSQLRTVIYIANKHKGYGLPQEDLVQEGTIGLMKAVKNFSLSHKVRLYTYALIWIKSEIQSYIIKNWKLVKIGTTKNFRKLFFGFKETQKELMHNGVSKEQIIDSISLKLGVSKDEALEIQGYLNSEDSFIDQDDDSPVLQISSGITPEDIYEEKHDSNFYSEKLNEALSQLNERQRFVIERRYLSEEKQTHKDLAKELNVSSERIRQIEQEALMKIKKIISI